MRMVEIAISEQNNEPLFFSLAGTKFECLPAVPAGLHRDLVDMKWMISEMLPFIDGILKDEKEIARFHAFIHGKTPLITSQDLVTLIQTVVSEYAARPLVTPKRSANGRTSTSRSSKRRSKPKASRSSA